MDFAHNIAKRRLIVVIIACAGWRQPGSPSLTGANESPDDDIVHQID